MLKKLKVKVYLVLKDEGRQSHINNIVEYMIAVLIILNVFLIVVESIDSLARQHRTLIIFLRNAFFIFFLTEYILRFWIADIVLHGRKHPVIARIKYMLTFRALVDLLALFPVMFGASIIDFRIFRVLRLLRITQLKGVQQYTSTLIKVFKIKGTQLLSSFFIVLIFIFFSAVIIYDLENPVQPGAFNNILTALWWSVSTITTVGYGDIYPITWEGRAIASCISLVGILIMAIPIGILSAGFFEVSKEMEKKANEESECGKDNG